MGTIYVVAASRTKYMLYQEYSEMEIPPGTLAGGLLDNSFGWHTSQMRTLLSTYSSNCHSINPRNRNRCTLRWSYSRRVLEEKGRYFLSIDRLLNEVRFKVNCIVSDRYNRELSCEISQPCSSRFKCQTSIMGTSETNWFSVVRTIKQITIAYKETLNVKEREITSDYRACGEVFLVK